MGIRIHKVLGYGFNDLRTTEPDKYGIRRVDDSRFNPNGWWHAKWDDKEEIWTTEGFKAHCQQIVDDTDDKYGPLGLMLMEGLQGNHFRDIHSTIAYDYEGGDPEVVVFMPFTNSNWKRFDDVIDYYDHEVKPSVKLLDVPIWPYSGYIDRETGERVDRDTEHWIYLYRNAPETSREDEIRSLALKGLGCEKHWMEKYNVSIPEELIEFFRYTKMFADEKAIWSLRPMIYTYWA